MFDTKTDFALTIQQRRDKILNDRFAPGSIISKDAKTLGFVVRAKNGTTTPERFALRKQFMEIIEQSKISEHFTSIAGGSEMTYVQFESMIDSLKKFIPLTIILSLTLISWMFPRLPVIILASLSIGIVCLAPTVLLGAMGYQFTMVHTMISPLMSALCTALLIHYMNKIKYYSRLNYSSIERVQKAHNDIKKPAAYTAFTTAAGLGALSLSPIPPIQSFGIVTAFGVGLIIFTILVLCPPILAKWDKDTPWRQGHSIDNAFNIITKFCAKLAIRYAGWILTITIIIVALGIAPIRNIKIETDVFNFFDETHRVTVDTNRIEDTLSGTTMLDIFIQTEDFNALKQPENLEYLVKFQKWLNAQPEIDRTSSMVEMIEEMHWAFNNENPNFRTLPDNEALISQYIFVFDGNDLYELVNYDFNTTRITANLNIHEAGQVQVVMNRIKEYSAQNPLEGFTIQISGFGSLYANLSNLVVRTQLVSLLVALVIISALMFFIFRSWSSTFLCMIPNISPAFVTFALMGILDIWLDFGTAMIASVGVGIAVDDTIHLYHDYIKRKRAGRGTILSIMRAYQHAGRAIVATTFVLSSQFLIIATSDFLPTRNFGFLSAASIVAALIFDLLVLPAVIVTISKFKKTQ